VVPVHGRMIGDGMRGPMVQRLQELYMAAVESDVAGRVAP
jgi:hypothetical protein